MSYIQAARNYVTNQFLKFVSNDRIRIESVIRENGTVSGLLTLPTTSMKVETFKSWKQAIMAASDPNNPDRTLLVENYASLMFDCHLMACIDTRIVKVQRSKLKVMNSKTGEENPELTALLNRPWMDKFTYLAMKAEFVGTSLIELSELDENLEIAKVTEVPQTNFKPKKGIIVKESSNTTGWDYKEGMLADYYIQVGEDNFLGLLQNLGPVVIGKKIAFGVWLDYIEKLGVPPRWVTTESVDKNRLKELMNMMQNMISSSWAVLQGTEKIEIADVKGTNANDIFNILIDRYNSEMSKRILGSTGTMEEKSFVGSALVHQAMALERHLSDKVRMVNIINTDLLPRLQAISSIYNFDGHHVNYDDSYEMDPATLVDKAIALSEYYNIDLEYLTKRTGIPILGIKETTADNTPAEKKKPEIRAFYEAHGCNHHPAPDLTAIDLSRYNDLLDKIAQDLYEGKIKPGDVNIDLVDQTFNDLEEAAGSGYGKGWKPLDQKKKDPKETKTVRSLKNNLYRFSGAKSAQQLAQINKLLVDENGKIKPFPQFKKEVLELNKEYNVNYLKTEYNTSLKSAQMARQWKDYEAQKHLFPNLEFRTAGDDHVREKHAKLNGIVKPVDSEFWDKHTPPLEFNCRCHLRQTDKQATEEKNTPEITIPKLFQNNPWRTGVVYNDDHPYFTTPGVNANELFEKIELSKLQLKSPVEYVSKNGAKVSVSKFADPVDIDENYETAKVIADQLKKDVEIRPHINVPGWTNPEYKIEDKIADRAKITKGVDYVFRDKKKQIESFTTKFNKQFSAAKINTDYTIVIDMSDIKSFSSFKYAKKIIGQLLSEDNSLVEVFLVHKSKGISITKEDAVKGKDVVVKLLQDLYK